jgi:hypothetical protein
MFSPFYVIMPVFIAQDVVISSLLLNLFSKGLMKIMSLPFNRVYDQAYHFFWESFLIKTHKHIFEALCNLIDAICLFYQNQFSYWSFEKKWSCILIPKIIWCLFKNHIFNILLVEWQVNQATSSLRWLNYKQKNE